MSTLFFKFIKKSYKYTNRVFVVCYIADKFGFNNKILLYFSETIQQLENKNTLMLYFKAAIISE